MSGSDVQGLGAGGQTPSRGSSPVGSSRFGSCRRAVAVVTALTLGVLGWVTVVTPSLAGAESLEDIRERLEQVQQRQDEVREEITRNQTELEELHGRIAELAARRDELTAEVARHERELAEIDELVAFRVRETFKHGANLDPLSVLFTGDDPAGALAKAATVQRLVSADQVRSGDIEAARTRARASAERLEATRDDLTDAQEQFAAVSTELTTDLESLEELEGSLSRRERAELERREQERRERERREREQAARRAAASGSTTTTSSGGGSGATACPLDQPRSFIDSWGYPRSGGRSHRGTDIMGPHGIPVRAITSGTYHHQSRGRSAGVWAILRGDDGDHYWYLHLTSHTVADGARVSAGQQVGTNGSTGNASAGAPHVHFELHPGGGGAVNPYPVLRSVCG